MTRSLFTGFAATLLALAIVPGSRVSAQSGAAQSGTSAPAQPQVSAQKKVAAVAQAPATATAAATTTANKVQMRQVNQRQQRAGWMTNRTRRGPTNYNYSGVGFPGMEGGLTAAANRTTWGKPMYSSRRRGGW